MISGQPRGHQQGAGAELPGPGGRLRGLLAIIIAEGEHSYEFEFAINGK